MRQIRIKNQKAMVQTIVGWWCRIHYHREETVTIYEYDHEGD